VTTRRYLPAAGHDFLLPLYDPLTRLLGGEALANRLVDQAELRPSHTVLDIGCGTGAIAVALARRHPGLTVVGIDPDPRALARARRKAVRGGMPIRFAIGFADALPHADATFDRVFSSMMFHHLGRKERASALAEWRRVLKPGGRLEFLDFASGSGSLLGQWLHGRQLAEGAEARLLSRMREAGFVDAKRTAAHHTILGPLGFFQAAAPSERGH
jgi:ubiquinone/menaquinone biosynthesis C-methylase UbiE